MKEYGVGIIGMGFMGKTHAYAHKTLPFYYQGIPFKTRLITACNRSAPAALYARDSLGFETASTSEDEVFDNPEIDIVHICTPNEFHYAQCKKALASGKHVYCDKPLALNYAQAAELSSIAKASGRCAQIAFQNRFFPATLKALELVKEGRIGDILCFRCNYLHSGSVDPLRPMGWKQGESGGVLLDLGSHAIDLMYMLLGRFESVYARRRVLYPTRPGKDGTPIAVTAEDHVNMLLTLPSGALGTIEATKIATGTDDVLEFEIHGTLGAMRFNLMEPNTLWFYDNTRPGGVYGGERGFIALETTARYAPPGCDFPSPKNSLGWIRSHCHSLFSFLDNVYANREGSPSFEDGAYVQLVMEKALMSSKIGAEVKI